MGHNTRKSPGCFYRALPFAFPALGYLVCLHSRVSYPTTIPTLDIPALTVYAILGNLPEEIMRISREKIVTHYNQSPRDKLAASWSMSRRIWLASASVAAAILSTVRSISTVARAVLKRSSNA